MKKFTGDETPEEIMKIVANEHSYDTWSELMNDSDEISQIYYTKEAMIIYAKEFIYNFGKNESWGI